MNDATATFEERTKRMLLILRFLAWDHSPGEEADPDLVSAHNLAVEASYHAVRQLALETCINSKPLSLNDLSRDSETSLSQAAPDGPVQNE